MFWLKRILLNSLLFASILFLPWYIPVILGILFYWKYSMYEILAWALCMDILYDSYHVQQAGWFPALVFTYSTALLILILNLIKKRIRFYA